MHLTRIRGLAGAGAVAALSAAALTVPAAASAAPSTSVVAKGLNVPKYLQFHRGGLYVAESGRGGSHCTPGTSVSMNTPTRQCVGATGRIVRIDKSGTHTVLRGLSSSVDAASHEIVGPVAVAFAGARPVVLQRVAFNGPTGVSNVDAPFSRQFGKLFTATPRRVNTRVHTIANISRYGATHPQTAATMGGLPGELTFDSDPHDAVAYRGGYAVADAGANDVLYSRGGKTTVLARLATRSENAPAGLLGPGSPALTVQAQAVPSSVTVGPDGALYVGLLRGVPSLPGTAEVDRIVPGQKPTVAVSGLTRVSDVAFDRQGRLLVLEASTKGEQPGPGALLRATPQAGKTVTATDLGVSGLTDPTGVTVARDGSAYVTNDTKAPGAGQVLKISGLS